MESKFKVGAQVLCVNDKGYTNGYVVKGAVYTITDKTWNDCDSDEVSIIDVTSFPRDFKLYKEKPVKQFDMRTQPWFIRVNNEQEFNLVQEWLEENFGTVPYFGWYPQTKGLTNTNVDGKMYSDYVMWFCDDKNLNQNANEIKVNFKTIIDSVEWPVVESEKDKKIRELEETIKKAQEQIKELQKLS